MNLIMCAGDRRSTGGQGAHAHNVTNPGNNPQQGPFKPHPPNKLPPPNRIQGRLVHSVKRMDITNHRGGAPVDYHSGSDEQTDADSARKQIVRNHGHFARRVEEEDNQIHSSSRVTLPK